MATTKKNKSATKKVTPSSIISSYMEYVLEHEQRPKSVHSFCRSIEIADSDFYEHFGSLSTLQSAVWNQFMDHAIKVVKKDENYAEFSERDRLLSLYYTLFELFTANRSYVLFELEDHQAALKHMKEWKGFRHSFKSFIEEEVKSVDKEDKRKEWGGKAFSEVLWFQFLFLLKFWLEDESKKFEKTDVLIEKTVRATFDVIDTKPFESLIDFGKFIWKEKVS